MQHTANQSFFRYAVVGRVLMNYVALLWV